MASSQWLVVSRQYPVKPVGIGGCKRRLAAFRAVRLALPTALKHQARLSLAIGLGNAVPVSHRLTARKAASRRLQPPNLCLRALLTTDYRLLTHQVLQSGECMLIFQSELLAPPGEQEF